MKSQFSQYAVDLSEELDKLPGIVISSVETVFSRVEMDDAAADFSSLTSAHLVMQQADTMPLPVVRAPAAAKVKDPSNKGGSVFEESNTYSSFVYNQNVANRVSLFDLDKTNGDPFGYLSEEDYTQKQNVKKRKTSMSYAPVQTLTNPWAVPAQQAEPFSYNQQQSVQLVETFDTIYRGGTVQMQAQPLNTSSLYQTDNILYNPVIPSSSDQPEEQMDYTMDNVADRLYNQQLAQIQTTFEQQIQQLGQQQQLYAQSLTEQAAKQQLLEAELLEAKAKAKQLEDHKQHQLLFGNVMQQQSIQQQEKDKLELRRLNEQKIGANAAVNRHNQLNRAQQQYQSRGGNQRQQQQPVSDRFQQPVNVSISNVLTPNQSMNYAPSQPMNFSNPITQNSTSGATQQLQNAMHQQQQNQMNQQQQQHLPQYSIPQAQPVYLAQPGQLRPQEKYNIVAGNNSQIIINKGDGTVNADGSTGPTSSNLINAPSTRQGRGGDRTTTTTTRNSSQAPATRPRGRQDQFPSARYEEEEKARFVPRQREQEIGQPLEFPEKNLGEPYSVDPRKERRPKEPTRPMVPLSNAANTSAIFNKRAEITEQDRKDFLNFLGAAVQQATKNTQATQFAIDSEALQKAAGYSTDENIRIGNKLANYQRSRLPPTTNKQWAEPDPNETDPDSKNVEITLHKPNTVSQKDLLQTASPSSQKLSANQIAQLAKKRPESLYEFEVTKPKNQGFGTTPTFLDTIRAQQKPVIKLKPSPTQTQAKTATDNAVDMAAAMYTDAKGLISMSENDLDRLLAALLPIGQSLVKNLNREQKANLLQAYHNHQLENDIDLLMIQNRQSTL